jgi:hypothetical protein
MCVRRATSEEITGGIMSTLRLTLLLIVLLAPRPVAAQTADETGAVEQAVLDYVEGWWAGDVTRMERSLHPDLVKRIVFTHEATGRSMINSITKSDMVEYTRAGGGSEHPEQKGEVEVMVLRVDGNIATVVATSARYVDYLHLAKWNGSWVIVNVLWGGR